MSPAAPRRLAVAGLSALLFCAGAEGVYRAARSARGWLGSRRGGFDLYAVGGSVATGYPYSDPVAFPNIVSLSFDGELGGRRIALRTVTSPGNSIASDYFYLKDLLASREPGAPGAVLVYGGVINPAPYPGRPRLLALFRRVRRGLLGRSRLVEDLLFYADRAWRVSGDSPAGYEESLRGILQDCLRAGLLPVLATAAEDKAGREPAPAAGVLDFGRLAPELLKTVPLERRGDCAGLQERLGGLKPRFPGAERLLQHRACRCLEAAGAYEKARACYAAISGGDAVSRQNEILRDLARQYRVPIVETQALLESHAPHGIAGAALFANESHPSIEGQLLLAEAFARELSSRFETPVKRVFHGPGELLKATAYPEAARVCGLVGSGFLALTGAEGVPYAPQRVGFAAEQFKKALELSPGDGPALLGLGLAEAARAAGDTVPSLKFCRLDRIPSTLGEGGTECVRPCFTGPGESSARAGLQEAGVPGPRIEEILRSGLPTGCR